MVKPYACGILLLTSSTEQGPCWEDDGHLAGQDILHISMQPKSSLLWLWMSTTGPYTKSPPTNPLSLRTTLILIYSPIYTSVSQMIS
jgi:hypothetical protein